MAGLSNVAGAVMVAAVLGAFVGCSGDVAGPMNPLPEPGPGPGSGPGPNRSPEAARFVTDDIARFWVAFAKIGTAQDTLPLRRDYLDRGTIGLTDFTDRRWKNARTLTSMVYSRWAYYASIRANTLQISALEPEMRLVYGRMQELYPPAVFPDVYFVIGGLGTGGTTSPNGLLIGAELFSRTANSPVHELTPWQQAVTKSPDLLPAIVAHELVHFQQTGRGRTLLAQAITEGSADFIGELLSGKSTGADRQVYGDAHEAELWREFRAVMDGTDISQWLYNGGSVTGPDSRPADLGYYIGSRITQAYYERAEDKMAAIREILTVTDARSLLLASGYMERFGN